MLLINFVIVKTGCALNSNPSIRIAQLKAIAAAKSFYDLCGYGGAAIENTDTRGWI
jgi:hypothetical protein